MPTMKTLKAGFLVLALTLAASSSALAQGTFVFAGSNDNEPNSIIVLNGTTNVVATARSWCWNFFTQCGAHTTLEN